MPEPFSKTFEIDYRGARADMRTGFVRLMDYVQEASIAHTNSTTFPMLWFMQNHRGWVITNWQVEICSYPQYGNMMTIETWPSFFKGILGERSFLVRDGAGRPILKAFSSWIYTDLDKRRPVRPEADMLASYGENFPPVISKDFALPPKENFNPIGQYTFTVMGRDIDTNQHVNNVRYLEWAVDGIPWAITSQHNVSLMKTTYRKECGLGDSIAVLTYQHSSGQMAFLSEIYKTDAEPSPALLTEIYTEWT